jgi:hypothetical protein
VVQKRSSRPCRARREQDLRSAPLYLNDIDPICTNWASFRNFKITVDAICGKPFRTASNDFRNAYNHRFAPHFVLGMSGIMSRKKQSDGSVSYSLGGTEALDLTDMADLLQKERDLCLSAFQAFQALTGEHELAITESTLADAQAIASVRICWAASCPVTHPVLTFICVAVNAPASASVLVFEQEVHGGPFSASCGPS